MTTFERSVLGLMGLCTVSLLAIAMSTPNEGVPQSPKATFASTDIDVVTASGAASALKPFKVDKIKHLTVGSLSETFSTLQYDLEDVRDEGAAVPRVFVVNMPHDMPHIQVPAERKRIFFKTVLPLVLKANDDVLKDRQRLLRIKAENKKFSALAAADRLWLSAVAERYRTRRDNISELVRRADIVPPSLALAQAAEESGWGTSRFALEGNALFGQWTTLKNQAGLTPNRRDEGKTHRIKAFTTLMGAVRAYVRNLNTHRAYRKFRQERQALRRGQQSISGRDLAPTLTSYSERGIKYVQTIQSIIRVNELFDLDKARLGGKTVSAEGKPLI